jgi:ABC-type nickel/cobalt efflux system permease component RcnA
MVLLNSELAFVQWPLLAGLIAAIAHVLSGPDHLAAVMPFAVEHKKSAWKIGVSWGLGHLFGMLLIGLLFMIFKNIFPLELVSAYSEFSVGFVLIFIGVWAIYRTNRSVHKHQHPHFHPNTNDFHIHPHEHHANHFHQHPHLQPIKKGLVSSFSVGVLHGFAGIAHFILFLPLLSFKTNIQSVNYILGFAVGTIFAMSFFSFVIGLLSQKSAHASQPKLFDYFRYFAGAFAIIIGFYWIFTA